MKKPDFDELLAACRQTGPPPLQSNFPSHVLREIRLRSARKESGWLSLLSAWLRPGMVAASLAVAISVGALVPGLVRADGHSRAASGLGLDVFSTSAPKIPSGILP